MRTSKISQKSGKSHVCRVSISVSRASLLSHTYVWKHTVKTVLTRERVSSRMWWHCAKREKDDADDARVPLDQRQSAVKQWRAAQRGFYCIAERAKLKAQCDPSLARIQQRQSYSLFFRTLGSLFLSPERVLLSFFFFFPYQLCCTHETWKMRFLEAFLFRRLHARYCIHPIAPSENVNDLEALDVYTYERESELVSDEMYSLGSW